MRTLSKLFWYKDHNNMLTILNKIVLKVIRILGKFSKEPCLTIIQIHIEENVLYADFEQVIVV